VDRAGQNKSSHIEPLKNVGVTSGITVLVSVVSQWRVPRGTASALPRDQIELQIQRACFVDGREHVSGIRYKSELRSPHSPL
jgi:hypothetical protein